MNRRQFVSRVSMSAAATAVAVASPSARTRSDSAFTLRFVGMMGFVQRSDGSYLVATPGNTAHAHLSHQPFLMARAGSRVGQALGMAPAHGVVPGAFDMRLADARPDGFVYRCLDNTSLDVVSRRRSGGGQSLHSDGADGPHRSRLARARQHRAVGHQPGVAPRRAHRRFVGAPRRGAGLVLRHLPAAPHRRREFRGQHRRPTPPDGGRRGPHLHRGRGERRGTVGHQRGAGARSGQPDAAGAQRGGVRLPRGGRHR